MTKGSSYGKVSLQQSSAIRSFPMNTTIPQISQAMGHVLNEVAQDSAKETGFRQRHSKLGGAIFVQTRVLGWLNNPQASLEALTQMAASLGVKLTPQALDQRFSPQAAHFLEAVLQAALGEVVCAEPAALTILERFKAVLVQDSSMIVLPDELQEVWSGCGGRGAGAKSALKLQVRLDLKGGTLEAPILAQGRWHDQKAAAGLSELP